VSLRARDNPFRTEQTDALKYRAPDFRWSELLARLERQGGRGAIRGPQGSGKSTLLRELGGKLADLGYEVRHLRPSVDDRRLKRNQVRKVATGASSTTAILLDGADRVGLVGWRRLRIAARAAGIVVVTTHREGRLPTLYRCRTSVALLRELATEVAVTTDLASIPFTEIFSHQQGNIRTSLRALYDQFAEG
jgi:hypothetical protein